MGRDNLLSAEDQVISDFARHQQSARHGRAATAPANTPAAPIVVASPWPARTSIACKCDGLPLPPAAKDPQSQLAMMRGVSYVILGDSVDNARSAFNFAQLGAQIEVLAKSPAASYCTSKPPRSGANLAHALRCYRARGSLKNHH
jgi:hypothetical protein